MNGQRKNGTVRVVVTGRGGICGLGGDVATLWQGLIRGDVAINTITKFDISEYATQFAAELKDFAPSPAIDRKAARRMDRFTQFAVIASREAVTEASIEIAPIGERVAVFLGTALAGFETFSAATETMFIKGPRRVSPFAVPMTIPNMAPGMVAIDLGAKGPAFAFSSAFAGAANAIGEGVRAIQCGRADVVVAGGAEAPVTRLGLAAFAAMGATSTRNGDPTCAVRPFDLHRDGCALGEGAGVLVLESLDNARARGAKILSEIVGYAATAEAFHDVQLEEHGDGIVRSMRLAIAESGIGPVGIGYINAHGTGTEMNDTVETRAIREVFGDAAETIPISSTKAQTGHLLGAAGGLEAVIAITVLNQGILPATVNLTTPDPSCDLDYIPGTPRTQQVNTVLSNSMGFGGHSVSLVFAKPDAGLRL